MPGGEETIRQIERDVMLQIIDQRWRDHLAEMDYLKDGIHLRAMGNQDPLVAWQREGFAMFGQLMDGIDDDYLRYVFHVQVVRAGGRARSRPGRLPGRRRPGARGTAPSPRPSPPPRRPSWSAAAAGLPGRATGPHGRGRSTGLTDDGETQVPIVKARAREDRPQRAVLVRERQEVQALPWRRLRGPADGPVGGPASPSVSTSESLRSLAERLAEAERYLGREQLVVRRAELEKAASEPGLWDDADHAREVTTELGRVTADLEQLDALAGSCPTPRPSTS